MIHEKMKKENKITNNDKRKAFLIWADNGPEVNYLIKSLEEHSCKVVYWVGKTENTSEFPEIIFHDHYAAWAGLPPKNGSEENCLPPSKELIKKMAETESLVLSMMNKKFDILSVDERRHLYYRMLGYWDTIIRKYKPYIIIFPAVPHTVYNFIIYSLAREYKIRTVMFEDSWVSDRLLMYRDWREGSLNLHLALQRNKNKNFRLLDLTEDLQEYWKSHNDPKNDVTPIYINNARKKFSTFNKMLARVKIAKESLKNGTLLTRCWSYYRKQFKSNLKKEYESLQFKPKFDIDYLYVPLSFQPERTTSPQGDVYGDQILMIETLSKALPPDLTVYVKEHPAQWLMRSNINYSSSRYEGYYKKIANLTNVKLVPFDTSTYDLINAAKAVVVCAGTAGWEAIMRCKPVINFGYPWYRDFKGIFKVESVESCKVAVEKIMGGYKITEQDIINFLKSFGEASSRAYIESMVEKISKLSKKESMEILTKLIIADTQDITSNK
ncbi:MAG: hypothetical protein AAB534_00145 [Patescibacteria group bacterium]